MCAAYAQCHSDMRNVSSDCITNWRRTRRVCGCVAYLLQLVNAPSHMHLVHTAMLHTAAHAHPPTHQTYTRTQTHTHTHAYSRTLSNTEANGDCRCWHPTQESESCAVTPELRRVSSHRTPSEWISGFRASRFDAGTASVFRPQMCVVF